MLLNLLAGLDWPAVVCGLIVVLGILIGKYCSK